MKSFIICHLSLLLPNKYETMILSHENYVSGLTLHNLSTIAWINTALNKYLQYFKSLEHNLI